MRIISSILLAFFCLFVAGRLPLPFPRIAVNEPYIGLFAFIVLAFGTVIFAKLTKVLPKLAVIYMLLTVLGLDIAVRLLEGVSDYAIISLIRIVYYVFGIVAGYWFLRRKYKYIVITFVMLSACSYIANKYMMDKFANYVMYGSSNGKIIQPLPVKWVMQTETNDTITDQTIKGKTVILDFWNTHCGVCFKKFPQLEKLYVKINGNDNMLLYAVNIPWEKDSVGQALDAIRSRGYHFPVTIGNEQLANIFKIEGYPTVIVIRDNKIVFRGNIDNLLDYKF